MATRNSRTFPAQDSSSFATTDALTAERTAVATLSNKSLATESLPVITNNLPAIQPTLNLDFANSETVDPRITFTRASTATRTNKKGLIELVPSGVPRIDFDQVSLACEGLLVEEARTQLLTYSQDFDNAAWVKSNVTVTANAITAPDGTVTADKLIPGSGTGYKYLYESSTIAAGATSTVSVYAKAGEFAYLHLQLTPDGTNLIFCGFNLTSGTAGTPTNGGNGSSAVGIIQPVGNGWYRCSLSGIHSSSVANPLAAIYANNTGTAYAQATGDGTSGIYIWGAQLEAGSTPSTYIPSTVTHTGRTGTATFIGSNGLIQTAATGVARYQYNPLDLTVAPFLLLEGAGTNLLLNSATLVTQNVTVTAVAHTLSFYGTGTVTLSGVATGAVTGTGAYPTRTTLTFTPTAGALTLTVTGSCTDGQLEIGSYATSAIPTTTAAVTRNADTSTSAATTRAADVAVMTGANFSSWYRQDEGSFVASYSSPVLTTDGNSIFSVLETGKSNVISARVGFTGTRRIRAYSQTTSGSFEYAVDGPTNTAETGSIALAYASKNDFAVSDRGGTVAQDTSGDISTQAPKDRLVIGDTYATRLNGHIRKLSYFDKRLTNAELQALSAQ